MRYLAVLAALLLAGWGIHAFMNRTPNVKAGNDGLPPGVTKRVMVFDPTEDQRMAAEAMQIAAVGIYRGEVLSRKTSSGDSIVQRITLDLRGDGDHRLTSQNIQGGETTAVVLTGKWRIRGVNVVFTHTHKNGVALDKPLTVSKNRYDVDRVTIQSHAGDDIILSRSRTLYVK